MRDDKDVRGPWGGGPVRALTIRQPWAWAVARGGKDVENRSWRTAYRGPLLIHAAVDAPVQGEIETVAWTVSDPGSLAQPRSAWEARGAIIGVVLFTDILTDSPSPGRRSACTTGCSNPRRPLTLLCRAKGRTVCGFRHRRRHD